MAGFKNIKENTNNTSSGLKDKVNNFKQSVNDNVANLNEASNIQKQSRTYNKMFGSIPGRTSLVNSNNPMGSWVKYGRYNILPRSVAFEFNTYKNWAPFSILMEPNNYENGKPGEPIDSYVDDLGRKINEIYYDPLIKDSGIIGRKSLFNPFAAVNETNAVRMSINAPLLDSPQASVERATANDCGIKALVDASTSGRLGVATYSYADFMYCKYLGKCSNEYLITLRRFAYPPGDHINTVDYNNTGIENETQHHTNDIGRMVTWMGTPGNEMGNILKYSVKIPYKEFTAKMQEVDENKSTSDGILASIMNLGDKRNLQLIEEGSGGAGSTKLLQGALGLIPGSGPISKMGNFIGDPPYTSDDWKKNYDQNKSYGPLDVITKTWKRAGADDGDGLEFDQDITLQFDYELRSYDGINGRAAMMDLLSNILATCYTTGKFWGGSTRFLGASQSNVYANLPIFMRNNGSQEPGDFATYSKRIADSFNMAFTGGNDKDSVEKRRDTEVKTYKAEKKKNKKESKGSGVIEKATSIFSDIGSLIQNAGSALGSLLYGGLINKLGRPAVLAVNSLLSDAPTGLWHLTIGNPKAPIMSMGNMIIDNCEIEHTGPLGIDGFPTGLSVKIKLKHGKPRENTAIERMYMQGDYRIYSPMGDKVLKMYWGAPSLAMMAASNVRQNQINEKKISEEDYRKSQFYVDDYVDDFSKVAPKDATTDTINLARYFGTVATLKNTTSPAEYLRNTGKEALFGSTSTKQAQNNDKRDELLEKRYKALGNQVEEEKKVTEAKETLNQANEDLSAFKEVQSEGVGGHDVYLWSWGVNRDSLKVTWEAAMGDSDLGTNYSFEFTGDPSTWMGQYRDMVSSLKGHKNYDGRKDNDEWKKNFDTQTSDFEKTLKGIIAAKQKQLESQETINEASAAKSNAG